MWAVSLVCQCTLVFTIHKLQAVLLHQLYRHLRGLITETSKLQSYIDNDLIPWVRAVKDHPALGGWNIINEFEGFIIPGQHNSEPCFDTTFLQGSGAGWVGRLYFAHDLLRLELFCIVLTTCPGDNCSGRLSVCLAEVCLHTIHIPRNSVSCIYVSYSKNVIGVKKSFQKKKKKKDHFAHIGNGIKICSQSKCYHHLSNVCENSFRMFHSNWVISDYHSFVWAV